MCCMVAVSNGMQAVKLRTNKILRFLTRGVGLTYVDLCNGQKIMVVVHVRDARTA